ncbi:MAG TPA: hypothetical protein PKD70_02535 [Saprospiraceae bacterium]|nr:hypothetical protein [Saprospiraceae bacterium]HMP12730.1 hypothetical protein [Saprospiraceae bacterium]
MPIKYQDIRNERQWKASTGLSEKQFLELALEFAKAYENFFGVSMQERQSNSTSESTFKTYKHLLFFTLFSIKSGVTYDVLGLMFGLDGVNAHQNQALGLRILRAALKASGNLPKRTYESVKKFKEHWSQEDEIFINATEQRRQRPSDTEEQKNDYSGKKKPTP